MWLSAARSDHLLYSLRLLKFFLFKPAPLAHIQTHCFPVQVSVFVVNMKGRPFMGWLTENTLLLCPLDANILFTHTLSQSYTYIRYHVAQCSKELPHAILVAFAYIFMFKPAPRVLMRECIVFLYRCP